MEDYYKNEDAGELVKQFEQMLKADANYYFDVEVYETIIHHYKVQQQFAQALQACKLAIQHYPYSTDLKIEQAYLLANVGELQESLQLTEYLENIYPNNMEIMLLQEHIYMQLGEYEKCLEILHNILPQSEHPDEIYYRMGIAYQNIAKYPQAIKNYKKAIRLNQNLEHAVFELNYCLDLTGELEINLPFYEQFTDKDPYSYLAWYNLGLAYGKLEQNQKALEAFEYATLIQEDFTPAHYELGNAFMNLKQYKDAQKAYTQALIFGDESPELLCSLGASYEKEKDYTSALINYKEALRMDNQCDEAYYGVGLCLAAKEKWSEALHFLKKAIALNPQYEDYWLTLADAEYQLGNVLGCLEAYQKCSEAYPYTVDLWLNWSMVFCEQGDLDKAIEIINIGIEECPQEAALYYRATAYNIQAGNYGDSIKLLENALLLNFELHTSLFDFFPALETQKALYKLIEQITDK